MRWTIRIGVVVVGVLLLAVIGYTGYVGYEGSRQLVTSWGNEPKCATPDVQFGWAYEAINYDIADDAELKARNPDPSTCTYQGVKAGDDVVTDDGIHIAGWYIPAGNGAGPEAPTVILVHGFKASKSGILKYGVGVHDTFNLVVFDMRNVGRSTGDQTTAGVLEQKDLRAVIDWVERTKHPSHLGVLANSLGAVTALAEARLDPRIEAMTLDSMHTRLHYQLEARVASAGNPSYFGTTWAIEFTTWIRTGADITSIDAEDTIKGWGTRPLLITHGTADTEDLPARTQAFYDEVVAMGIPAELEWCPGSGHTASAGMPAEVCADQFATWTRDFFTRTLAS
jgi:pimeloyl-ACP methyl ester carboxylesterase